MRALVFGTLPDDVEKANSDAPGGAALDGDGIARSSIVRALLEHGTFDEYFVLAESRWSMHRLQDALDKTPEGRRASVITPHDLEALKRERRIALFEPCIDFYKLAVIRNYHGNPSWPSTGLTHTLSYLSMWNRVLLPLLGRLNRHDGIVCSSHSGRNVVEQIIADQNRKVSAMLSCEARLSCRLDVIPLCVDAAAYRPVTMEEKQRAKEELGLAGRDVALSLGRLTAMMKMDLGPVILAFARMVAPVAASAHLVLAGDDTRKEADKLRDLCSELGCEDRVTILTNVSWEQKLRLYAAADVFVAPSDNVQETFGQAVVEAMSAGVPVIASDWDGFRELVDHGVTGLRVPTQWAAATDEICQSGLLRAEAWTHAYLAQTVVVDLDALASAMLMLLGSAETRQRMGEAARARVLERYTRERVVASYERLWEDMWADAPAGWVTPASEEIGTLDRFLLFAGYPTERIHPNGFVAKTAMGERYDELLPHLRKLWERIPIFDETLCAAILAACTSASAPIGAVLDACHAATGERRDEIFRHIAHLAKQGFLRLEPAGGERKQTEELQVERSMTLLS
jgi:glycosyltransferase involved in cell wall biosynthesis